MKIASIGGIATVTMGLLLRSKINDNIKQTEYYKDAMKTVRTNKGAVYLLGEPIKDRPIDFDDKELNFTRDTTAQYEIPVRGPKQSGTIYFKAIKTNDKWVVSRIELGLENEPNRRLLIKNITE